MLHLSLDGKLTTLRLNSEGSYAFFRSKWLFPTPTGRPLTLEAIRRYLVPVLTQLGEDPNQYNTHSFRIGAATELFQRGVMAETIKFLGRWKGPTYELYNRPAAEQCAEYARTILSNPVHERLKNVTFLRHLTI